MRFETAIRGPRKPSPVPWLAHQCTAIPRTQAAGERFHGSRIVFEARRQLHQAAPELLAEAHGPAGNGNTTLGLHDCHSLQAADRLQR